MGSHARNAAVGRAGEDLASRHLRRQGYEILARNVRSVEGEIDILARDGKTLVVCEVKTRTTRRFGEPVEAITAPKAARLRRLTSQWLASQPRTWGQVRIDVVGILLEPGQRPALLHLKGVG